MTEKVKHALYTVIKAGIPYQDPPLELQIQYAIHAGIGDELLRIGFFTLLYGAAFRLMLLVRHSRTRRRPPGKRKTDGRHLFLYSPNYLEMSPKQW